MAKLRKIFAASVIFVTVLSMTAVAAPAGAAAKAGDLIKMNGLSTVYYLAADGKRYVFPNEQTYTSWYKDFSSVVVIPQSELESYNLGANVTIRPGTKLVKITTNPTVYAVEPNGSLRSIVSEANAIALWGADWAKRVVDVPDAFFTNYKVNAPLSAGVYPVGSIVKTSASADVYYFDGSTYRKFADEAAFSANRMDFANVVTASSIGTTGANITAAESALTDTSSGAGGTAGAGTGLTVSISSATAAAGNVPTGAPVDMLAVNLTASNDGAVSINSLTVTASGLGSAQNIDSVTLYDNGVKVGTSKDINSDKVATFNFATPINVAAGTTKTLVAKGTLASAGNYALGIAKAADVVTNGASVSGSFPITGNTMAGVTGVDIGVVTMSSVNGTDAPNTQFGTDNVLLAEFSLGANSNEPVLWSSARFKNTGTSGTLVDNMKITVDGVDVKTGASLSGSYVNFDMGNYELAKSTTALVQVYGDMGIGRTGDTVSLIVESADDFVLTGKDMGYSASTSAFTLLDATSEAIVVTLATGDFTLDMDKSSAGTPAKDVKAGDTNVALATIKMTSNGENATVQSIANGSSGDNFFITGTGLALAEISNIRLVDNASGATYDVAAVASGTNIVLSITDDISLVKGVTKTFTLKADLAGPTASDPIDNGNTIQATLMSSAMTIKGDSSGADITNVTPSSVSSSIATVKVASLTWTTQALTSKTIVPGTQNEVVYKAALEAGATSAVTLNSVKINTSAAVVDTFSDQNISSLSLVFTPEGGSAVTKTVSNQITEGTAGTEGYITFSGLSGFVVPAGKTATVELKASFPSTFATTTVGWTLSIDHATDSIVAKDAQNQNVAESVVATGTGSRTITLASTGTLKAELKTTDLKADVDTYILAGSETASNRYLGELVFTTANEPIKLKTLVLGQNGNATASDIKTVKLYDKNGGVVASVAPTANGHANFSNLNLTLNADQATSYFIGVVAKSMNADGDVEGTATFGRNIQFNFASSTDLTELGLAADSAVTADGVNSGQAVTMAQAAATSTTAVGEYTHPFNLSKTATVSGSVLTAIAPAGSNGTLTGGSETIAQYTFTFDNGANRTSANAELKAALKELKLTVNSSSGATTTNIQAYISGASANKTDAVDPVAGVATIDLTTLDGTTNLVDGTVTLVIIADTTVADGSQYIQTKIADLTTDFTYNGNAGTGSDFADARLDISDVIGTKLSK